MKVAIIDSGVANLASVESAFRSLGISVERATQPEALDQASHLVLPGVGSFEAGLTRIRELELDRAIVSQIEKGKPLLAICLGLQMLCEASDESPGTTGLGLIKGRCRRLPASVRVPHLGWNEVKSPDSTTIVQPGTAAFANSYALFDAPDGWKCSTTIYGERFISALERDSVLACQFHPELSGAYGLALIRKWLKLPSSETKPLVKEGAVVLNGQTGGTDRVGSAGETIRIIPCLDVSNGRVVKGVQFTNIRDAGDPAELAERYEDQGADEIVILDIEASPTGAENRVETVRRVRERIHIPLTVGGGVRTVTDAKRLLSAGADKISVNSAAVRDPSLIASLAREFGSQCVVVAIDARRSGGLWEVLINGGREPAHLNAVTWARQAESEGAGEILLTSWDRDGTRSGADNPLLTAVSSAVSIPVIASGGIGSSSDAASAVHAGAAAVLAASIFHDADMEVRDLKYFLENEGIGVRL